MLSLPPRCAGDSSKSCCPVYDRLQVPYQIIRYELLVAKPEETLVELLPFLDLPWHNDLLRHHQLDQGTAVGQTDRTRPIEACSVGKWKQQLLSGDLDILHAVCAQTAKDFGYELNR